MRLRNRINPLLGLFFCIGATIMGLLLTTSVAQQPPATAPAPATTQPSVQAANPIEAGKYIVAIGGCNDCHTPGWMHTGGAGIPDEALLTGSPVGFRGPWGTTYASNLRLFASQFTEENFVKVLKSRNTRPPMPWSTIHAMSDKDLGAVYKYITSLKPVGKPVPTFVPPGVEPKTPYVVLDPTLAPKAYAAAATQPESAPTTTAAPAKP